MSELWIAIIGSAVLLVPSIIAGLLWIGSLRGDIEHLKLRIDAMEARHKTEMDTILATIQNVSNVIQATAERLSTSREEALTRFVSREDFQRMENKLDAIRAAVR